MSHRYPRVAIEYCTQCRWLLRAGWTAQELLTTFTEEVAEVALQPGTGGVFDVHVQFAVDQRPVRVFSRGEAGRFPEMKELKQLIRDQVSPDRDLGHSDRES